MHHLNTLLRFHDDDCVYRTVEDLSAHGRLSRAFVRLCVAAGCPTRNGMLSLAGMLEWLFENYTAVRAIAGLPEVAATLGVTEGNLGRLKMGNAMLTLLEYTEMRSSRDSEKEKAREVRRCIELALDRH